MATSRLTFFVINASPSSVLSPSGSDSSRPARLVYPPSETMVTLASGVDRVGEETEQRVGVPVLEGVDGAPRDGTQRKVAVAVRGVDRVDGCDRDAVADVGHDAEDADLTPLVEHVGQPDRSGVVPPLGQVGVDDQPRARRARRRGRDRLRVRPTGSAGDDREGDDRDDRDDRGPHAPRPVSMRQLASSDLHALSGWFTIWAMGMMWYVPSGHVIFGFTSANTPPLDAATS
jgi:hypothetical protein